MSSFLRYKKMTIYKIIKISVIINFVSNLSFSYLFGGFMSFLKSVGNAFNFSFKHVEDISGVQITKKMLKGSNNENKNITFNKKNSVADIEKTMEIIKKFVPEDKMIGFDNKFKLALTKNFYPKFKKEESSNTIIKKINTLFSERESLEKSLSKCSDKDISLEYINSIEEINNKIKILSGKLISFFSESVQSKKEIGNLIEKVSDDVVKKEGLKDFFIELQKDLDTNEIDTTIESIKNFTENESNRRKKLVELTISYALHLEEKENGLKERTILLNTGFTKDSKEYKNLSKTIEDHENELKLLRIEMEKIGLETKKEFEKILKDSKFSFDDESLLMKKLKITRDEVDELLKIFKDSDGSYLEFSIQLGTKHKDKAKVKNLLIFMLQRLKKTIGYVLISVFIGTLLQDPVKNLITEHIRGPDLVAKKNIKKIMNVEQEYKIKQGESFKTLNDAFCRAAVGREESKSETISEDDLGIYEREEIEHFKKLHMQLVTDFENELEKIKPSKVKQSNFEDNKQKIFEAKKKFMDSNKKLIYAMNERVKFFEKVKSIAIDSSKISKEMIKDKQYEMKGKVLDRYNELSKDFESIELTKDVNKNLRDLFKKIRRGLLDNEVITINPEIIKNNDVEKKLLSNLDSVLKKCETQIKDVSKSLKDKNIDEHELFINSETEKRLKGIKDKIGIIKENLEKKEMTTLDAFESLEDIYHNHAHEVKDLARKEKKLESQFDDFSNKLAAKGNRKTSGWFW